MELIDEIRGPSRKAEIVAVRRFFARLMSRAGVSQEDIATHMNRDQSTINRYLNHDGWWENPWETSSPERSDGDGFPYSRSYR